MKKLLLYKICHIFNRTTRTAKKRLTLSVLTGIFISAFAWGSHTPKKISLSASRNATSTLERASKNTKKETITAQSALAAGPALEVSTTLKSINCDKTATYEVKICNNGDMTATGVTPNFILPENSGFVLKNISPDPQYPILTAGYTDPGGDTDTEGYDGYMAAKALPCETLDYSENCAPSVFRYDTFSKAFITHAAFGFPVSSAGSGIPQGAIILSAKLNVQLLRSGGSVGGIKRSDLAIFNASNNPGNLYTLFPTSTTVPAIMTEMDVTSVAQELVNQADWTNNSTMAFFVNSDGRIIVGSSSVLDAVSYLDISYILPATIAPGECVTYTYEYDVSNAEPGTYHMSTHVETLTAGTTFMPNTNFSIAGLSNQNGYDGTALTNTLDDTVIPENYEPVLNWTCPNDIIAGENISITATGSNIASTLLSSETSGTIVNTGTAEAPIALYVPSAQDITNKYATLKIESTSPTGCIETISCTVAITEKLPVKLIEFNAGRKENSVLLRWETALETNSQSFEIERSRNGKIWSTLGSVPAHVLSESVKKYQFTDPNPETVTAIYRLKMIDQDGTFTYSTMQEVYGTSSINVSVYPNPVSDRLTIATTLHTISTINLIDLKGNAIFPITLIENYIPVTTYPEGLYLLMITHKSGEIETQKILIKH